MIGNIGSTHPAIQTVQHAQSRTVTPAEDPTSQANVASNVSHAGRTQESQSTAHSQHQGQQSQNQNQSHSAPLPGSGPQRPTETSGNREQNSHTRASTDKTNSSQSSEQSIGHEKTHKVNGKELDQQQFEQVQELKQRDREVRQHEQAHLAAAGSHAQGGPSFSFQQGPDGKRYAVGGEVQIDTSPVAGDPQATIQKAQQIQAAATAPAEPSSQDRRVAAAAAQMASEARIELGHQRQVEQKQKSEEAEQRVEQNKPEKQTAAESAPEAKTPDQTTSHSSHANQKAVQTYQSVEDNSVKPKPSLSLHEAA